MAGSDRIYDRTTVKLSAVEQGTASVKLVALLSGSQMADRDYHVTVAHDDSLFNAYNKSNFDVDSTKFAKLLSFGKTRYQAAATAFSWRSRPVSAMSPAMMTPSAPLS